MLIYKMLVYYVNNQIINANTSVTFITSKRNETKRVCLTKH